jgi:hypothetical protein
MEYAIPKYDADLFQPNCSVPLSDAIWRRKVNGLLRYFGTPSNKHWFSEELFGGLMRVRGVEAAHPPVMRRLSTAATCNSARRAEGI